MAIDSKHRDLITCLWGETLQDSGCCVAWYCLFPSLITEQRFPSDAVLTDITRGRSPRHSKTGVSDIFGHQVSG